MMITFGGRRWIKGWSDINFDDSRKSFDGCDIRKLNYGVATRNEMIEYRAEKIATDLGQTIFGANRW